MTTLTDKYGNVITSGGIFEEKSMKVLFNCKPTVDIASINMTELEYTLERAFDSHLDIIYSRNDYEYKEDEIDMVCSVGGDGTYLTSAKYALYYNVPIIGVFNGTLGFLTEIDLDGLFDLDVSQYFYEYRMVVEWKGKPFLNDFVIKNSLNGKMMTYEIYVDDVKIGKFNGDGCIISTPMGSTAYNLSMNGPILDPENNTESLIINSMGTHTIFNRPLIVNGSKITLVPTYDCIIFIDGQDSGVGKQGEKIELEINRERRLKLLKFTKKSFYDVLSKKLHWNS